jgi:hypothetical protein
MRGSRGEREREGVERRRKDGCGVVKGRRWGKVGVIEGIEKVQWKSNKWEGARSGGQRDKATHTGPSKSASEPVTYQQQYSTCASTCGREGFSSRTRKSSTVCVRNISSSLSSCTSSSSSPLSVPNLAKK